MKKLSLLVVLLSFLFVACADKKTKEKVETSTEMEIEEVDTMEMDSLTTEIEQAKEDLEEASEEVDQLLKDL